MPFKNRSSIWHWRLGGLLGCLALFTVGLFLAAPPELRSSRAVSGWVFRAKEMRLPESWCEGGVWMPVTAREPGAVTATVDAVSFAAGEAAPQLPRSPVRLEAAACRGSAAIALAEFEPTEGPTIAWAATGTPSWGQAKAVSLFGDGALLREAAASLGNTAHGARQEERLPSDTGKATIGFLARLTRNAEGSPVLAEPDCTSAAAPCQRLVISGASRSRPGIARAGGLLRAAASRSQALRLSRALDSAQAPQAAAGSADADRAPLRLLLLHPPPLAGSETGPERAFRDGGEASACFTGWLRAGGFGAAAGLRREAVAAPEHCSAAAAVSTSGGIVELIPGAGPLEGAKGQLAVLTSFSELGLGREAASSELSEQEAQGLFEAAAAAARLGASVSLGEGEQPQWGVRGALPHLVPATARQWSVIGVVAQVVDRSRRPGGEEHEPQAAAVVLRTLIEADGMPAVEEGQEEEEQGAGSPRRAMSMRDVAVAAMSDGDRNDAGPRALGPSGGSRISSPWPQTALVAEQVGECGGPELCLARACEMLRTVGQSSAAAQLAGVCPRQHNLMDILVRGTRASPEAAWDDVHDSSSHVSKWEGGCHQVVAQVSPLVVAHSPSCDRLSATSASGIPAEQVMQSFEALALEAVEPIRACTHGVVLEHQMSALRAGAAPVGPGDVFDEPSQAASAETLEACALLGFQETLAHHQVPETSLSGAARLAAAERALGEQVVQLVAQSALNAVLA